MNSYTFFVFMKCICTLCTYFRANDAWQQKNISSTTVYKHSPQFPWFTVLTISTITVQSQIRAHSCVAFSFTLPSFVYTVDFYLENLQDLLISSLPNKAGCSKYRQLDLVLSYNLLRLSCVQLITLHIILQQHKWKFSYFYTGAWKQTQFITIPLLHYLKTILKRKHVTVYKLYSPTCKDINDEFQLPHIQDAKLL